MNQHRPILALIRACNPTLDALHPLPAGGISIRHAHLSEAWAVVNVLGAPDSACTTDDERAYNRGIGDALAAIEALGGCDPADLLRRFVDARRAS
ncbi:hypothetical protein MKK64_17300 [Methylobacterium sp. E-025]|uniref:hypothetical protein n=1 Tax=Methylobacterium sp. E-025 TaxID=2836561 RepID=UPI001FB87946|nr:hypothetical protein [Methylobacterium sp. E-025]MCJ2112940.1 hypothetical protein [Methylobacterium sp. E-025]